MSIRQAVLTVWIRRSWAVLGGLAIILVATTTLGLRGLGHNADHAPEPLAAPVQATVHSSDSAEETWHIVVPAEPAATTIVTKRPQPQRLEAETDWAGLVAGVADVQAASDVGVLPYAGLESRLYAADRHAIIAAVQAEVAHGEPSGSPFSLDIIVRRGGRGLGGGVCR